MYTINIPSFLCLSWVDLCLSLSPPLLPSTLVHLCISESSLSLSSSIRFNSWATLFIAMGTFFEIEPPFTASKAAEIIRINFSA